MELSFLSGHEHKEKRDRGGHPERLKETPRSCKIAAGGLNKSLSRVVHGGFGPFGQPELREELEKCHQKNFFERCELTPLGVTGRGGESGGRSDYRRITGIRAAGLMDRH